MRVAALLPLLLALPALAEPISIQRFETGDPDVWERIQRTRSDSLPLTLEEVHKLAKAGIAEKSLIEMMRTRGVLALADADTLLELKKAGASDASISAFSAYAVKPNNQFLLKVDLDLVSPAGIGPAPYLYVEVRRVADKRQEAFFFIDLRTQVGANIRRDRSDPSLPETIASMDFVGAVRTRAYGDLELRVAVSQKPDLQSLDDLNGTPMPQVKAFTLAYPAVSLDHRCELKLRVARDPSIRDFYTLQRGDLLCRWE